MFTKGMNKEEQRKLMSEIMRLDEESVLYDNSKDGKYYIYSEEEFNVSGYGKTKQEARESFIHNLEILKEDLDNYIKEVKK